MPKILPFHSGKNEEYILGRTHSLDWPHGRSGCLILLFEEGKAIISVRESRLLAKPGNLAILFPETSFVPLKISRTFSCFYLWVDERIMESANNRLTNLAFWDFLYQFPVFALTEAQRAIFNDWLRLATWTITEGAELYRDSLLSNQLVSLFMGIDNELIKHEVSGFLPEATRTFSLLGRFAALLATDATIHHNVQHYADRLCITPDYLNKITHRYFGISSKKMIDRYLIVEMKNYLSLKSYSVKEVAEKLGFADTSYMCRFFRRNTGQSPIEYRMHPRD